MFQRRTEMSRYKMGAQYAFFALNVPGMPWMFNWHIVLYVPLLIGIWLVAFVIQQSELFW